MITIDKHDMAMAFLCKIAKSDGVYISPGMAIGRGGEAYGFLSGLGSVKSISKSSNSLGWILRASAILNNVRSWGSRLFSYFEKLLPSKSELCATLRSVSSFASLIFLRFSLKRIFIRSASFSVIVFGRRYNVFKNVGF